MKAPDQAETLRRLMAAREAQPAPAADPRPVVAISGGAPGDGASTLAACLGASFAHWETPARVIDVDGAPNGQPLHWHSTAGVSILVITPRTPSIAGAEALARRLSRRFGKFRAEVVVNRVTGREGWQAFRKLKESEGRLPGVQLEYLGHLEANEKFARAMMNPEFLLDLKTGVLSNASLEFLSKRLRGEKFGGESAGELQAKGYSRLREEPATRTHRTGVASFWRSLLGGEA